MAGAGWLVAKMIYKFFSKRYALLLSKAQIA
jgi:hypothetical protein